MTGLLLVQLLLQCAVAALCLYIFVQDFRSLTISNGSILAGVGLYALWAVATGFDTLKSDALLGLGLFAGGIVCWLMKLIGGGDAKMLLLCGLFSGLAGIGMFALTLLVTSVSFYILIKLGDRLRPIIGSLAERFGEFGRTGRVPYGVPLAASTLAAFITRAM